MEEWELEEKRTEFINDFYYDKLKFCGCGSPSDTLYVIKKVLNVIDVKIKRCEESKFWDSNNYDLYRNDITECLNLKDETIEDAQLSINEGVIQTFLYLLDSVGVLEHGGSVGGAWLSEYGETLLEHLNKLSDEELDYILS